MFQTRQNERYFSKYVSIDMATFLLSERLEELVPRLKNKQSSCDRTPTTDVYSTEMLSDAVKQEVIKYYSSTHLFLIGYILNICKYLYY